MIAGIGIDSLEIARVEKAIAREAFLKRVFTENERAYLEEKGMAAQSAAGIFCAKEAVLKAVGLGITDVPLKDIEVLHEKSGAPYLKVYGKIGEKGGRFFLSITHTREYASAFTVWEREE
ncbi:holo-[acyl-carrier-protein] synthase [Christensenellaceae bacterium]|nr:holo-[acyl-carrier-protein] synthase [Christensenellaceae bacterium]BDF61328.1 holo-[acyl-carrier-protein] synthase [Christensenellaceae bacterium]